jgi:ADP-heptose:LPS heptosyltransferase
MGAPRIAVYVDLDLVGDALTKLPLARALRAAAPGAEIIWIAGRGESAFGGALAPVADGLIDRVIARSGVGAGLRAALGPGRLEVLIDTQSRLGTALALARLWPRRFASAALPGRRPAWLVARLLALGSRALRRELALDARPVAVPADVAAQAERLLPAGPRYVAQAVGAGGRHKAWPHHRALAERVLARGWVPVMILGPDEAELHAQLAAALPGARFPLQDVPPAGPALTIALAARCAVGVAGDCGGGHMLAAGAPRMVSLFGPTDPRKFAPWSPSLTILRAQHFGGDSMALIPVDAVLHAIGDA